MDIKNLFEFQVQMAKKVLFFQVIMGVFFYVHSVALIEDVPLEEHFATPDEFYAAANTAYSQVNNSS